MKTADMNSDNMPGAIIRICSRVSAANNIKADEGGPQLQSELTRPHV